MRINLRVRKTDEERLQHASHRGFTDPAQSEAGEGHPELHCVDELIELLVQLLYGTRAHTPRRYQLLDLGFAQADQGEFGGDKKRIRRDDQDDRHEAQHDEGNHEGKILTLADYARETR